MPVWTSLVLKFCKASTTSIATIRGRPRGGGNLTLAFDLRYASREKAIFGQPEVGGGLLPGGGGTELLPRTIGRDRALEVILTSADYDASTAEGWGWVTRALPDAELDAFVDAIVARLASFDCTSLASAKAMVGRSCRRMPTSSPPTASSRTPSPFPDSSLAPQDSRRCSPKQESTSSTASAVHRHRQPAALTPALTHCTPDEGSSSMPWIAVLLAPLTPLPPAFSVVTCRAARR